MVRVDATIRTEVMLGGSGVEIVELQNIMSLDYPNSRQWDGRHDGALPAANRAIASSRIHDAIGQMKFKLHLPAMASCLVLQSDVGSTHFFDNHLAVFPENHMRMHCGVRLFHDGE